MRPRPSVVSTSGVLNDGLAASLSSSSKLRTTRGPYTVRRTLSSGSVSLNVVQGLSVRISGYAARPRDQLSLAKQAATQEQILLQRRQLATQFEYFVSLGVSYTFGSIFNNVVNSRFGSGT